MLKRNIVVLLVALFAITPIFAQKFSKKEQLRREAREANFFYGATFTVTGGYVHSWLSDKLINESCTDFDDIQRWGQDRNSFNIGFQYDHALSKWYGVQAGLFYALKGGDHTYYRDQHLGSGPIQLTELTEKAKNQAVELQLVGRGFLPVSKRSRFSLNGGMYIDRVVESSIEGFGKWDMGLQAGVGYEWYCTSFSFTYQHSIYGPYIEDSKSRQSAIYVNIGCRFWK